MPLPLTGCRRARETKRVGPLLRQRGTKKIENQNLFPRRSDKVDDVRGRGGRWWTLSEEERNVEARNAKKKTGKGDPGTDRSQKGKGDQERQDLNRLCQTWPNNDRSESRRTGVKKIFGLDDYSRVYRAPYGWITPVEKLAIPVLDPVRTPLRPLEVGSERKRNNNKRGKKREIRNNTKPRRRTGTLAAPQQQPLAHCGQQIYKN